MEWGGGGPDSSICDKHSPAAHQPQPLWTGSGRRDVGSVAHHRQMSLLPSPPAATSLLWHWKDR